MGNGEPALRAERERAGAEAVLAVVLLAPRGGREQPERVLAFRWGRRQDTREAPCGRQ